MANSIIGTGLSALRAAQAGLATAQHNIANVNTPGFNRQQTIQSAAIPQFTGIGFIGRGAEVETVRRIYSEVIGTQLNSAQAAASELETAYAEIKQIDNLLADPLSGLSPALDDFFRGLDAVAAASEDNAARQAMLSSAQALAGRFQLLSGRLDDLAVGVNRQIGASVSAINAYAREIADLNHRIVVAAGAAGPTQAPNDLLDQRDALVRALNKEVGATVVQQADGAYNVFIGSGQALVLGNQAFALTTVADAADPRQMQVGLAGSGGPVVLADGLLRGGNLGGLLAFRAQNLMPAENGLGRIAIGLTQAMNEQHRLGQDRTGALGGDLFVAGAPEAFRSATNPSTAQITVALADFRQITTSDYRLQYDGTNYILTRLSDGVTQSFASLPQTVDGVSIQVASGTPQAGDSFLIYPTRAGAGEFRVLIADPAKIAAAAPMRSGAAIANTGTARISAGVVNGPTPNSNLRNTVTITFTGPNTYDVVDVTAGTTLATGVAYTPGAPISYNGWTVNIDGAAASGDAFTVSANSSGVGDNRNALALAALQTATLLANGTATYTSAYGQLVAQIGNDTRELEIGSESQSNLLAQVERKRESLSGVNLDEEAAALLRYQQAYQAAGKAIAVAGSLFDTLLDIVR
jgi:flagellar hook-associated protein 1 FlgK